MIKALLAFRKPLPRRVEVLIGALGFVVFLGAWQITANANVIRPEFLPAPGEVAAAFVRLFTERDFSHDILISVGRVWLAFFLSVVIAVPLGLCMSAYRSVGAFPGTVRGFCALPACAGFGSVARDLVRSGRSFQDRRLMDGNVFSTASFDRG